MTRKADFDAPSWELLCRAPLYVWLALSAVDSLVDSPAREAEAFEGGIEQAKRDGEGSELLLQLLDEAARPSAAQRRGSTAVDVEEIVRALERIRLRLEERCDPDEALLIKRALLTFGNRIALAANESVTGSRINRSQPEERFLYRARRALGVGAGGSRA